jgi:hypothetical protein
MEGPARMADEPGLDLGVLVGCVIVDNGVDQLIDDVYLIHAYPVSTYPYYM